MNKPLLLKLLRDLKERWFTLMALIFVLAIGVASYTSMAAVYRDLDAATRHYYQKYHLADFTIDLKRAPKTVLNELRNIPNIFQLRSRVSTPAMVVLTKKINSNPIPAIALSLPSKNTTMINGIALYRGRWFSSEDAREVLINEQFAEAHQLHVGDRIEVRLADKPHDLLIVGTARSPEFSILLPPGINIAPDPSGFAVLYLPERFLQERSDLNDSFNQLLGLVKNCSAVAIQNTMRLISDYLKPYGVQFQTAQADQVSVQIIHDELVQVKNMTKILPSMFLLVAILVLNVMMNRLIMAQRGSIGMLKALGYGNISIMRHYLSYGILIGFLGGFLGILLGLGLQHLSLVAYGQYFAIPHLVLHVYPEILIFGIIMSISSAVLGTLSGIRQAVKLAPAEAIRPPAPEQGVHILLENIAIFWRHVSFQTKMVFRSIFRNRFRSLITIGASILACALLLSSLEFLDAMQKMIDFSFDTVQHQDYTLSLRDPLGFDMMQTIKMLPDVRQIEPQLSVPAKLQNGPYEKRLEITGLPSQHTLFTPVDKEGNKVAIPLSGLVINETLANILHLHVGDAILVQPLLGNQKISKIKVTHIIKTYLGLNAYGNQIWLSHLLGNNWLANHILIKLYSNANQNLFVKAASQFAPMINLVSQKRSKELALETLERFLNFFVLIMIAFSGVIAVGSVVNTAMISLNERERDVASLRVLGFKNFEVGKIFFYESIFLNTIGIMIGLCVGVGFIYYISIAFSTEIYRMPVVIKAVRVFQTVLIMYLFVLISQVIMYSVVVKLDYFEILNVHE
ncbi:MAG: ABC transporter permease [Gammaproteobacteria bacterium]|nr:ABC transporter permease [Gammaproteobacteria bacterium]